MDATLAGLEKAVAPNGLLPQGVAIPARNGVARIDDCVWAVMRCEKAGRLNGTALLNGTTDDSAEVASSVPCKAAWAPWSCPWRRCDLRRQEQGLRQQARGRLQTAPMRQSGPAPSPDELEPRLRRGSA